VKLGPSGLVRQLPAHPIAGDNEHPQQFHQIMQEARRFPRLVAAGLQFNNVFTLASNMALAF